MGNRWEYAGLATTGVLEDDGSVIEGDLLLSYTESHRIVGSADHDGRSYSVRQETRRSHSSLGDDVGSWYSLVRQDRSGLFAADGLFEEPPGAVTAPVVRSANRSLLEPSLREGLRRRGASPATIARLERRFVTARAAIRGHASPPPGGGASPTELTWLLYPLHPGLSWSIRPDFPWPAAVAGVGPLHTPAGRLVAYRIETDPFGTTVGEGEWVRLWYGRAGFLGYGIHLVEEGIDEHGDPTGILYVIDDEMLLASASLAAP